MSTTLGPTVPLLNDGALSPPRYSLLSVATIVPDEDLHYLSGAEVWPWPDARSGGVHNPCATGTNREKGDQQDLDVPEFASFTVYETIQCTARSVRTEFDVWAARAASALQATESFQVEREISRGLQLPLSPHFADTNLNILNGGAALSPKRALEFIENAAARTGAAHLLHMDPATAVALSVDWLIEREGSEMRVTSTGTRVVVGTGYVGATPGAALGNTLGWIFATTPVSVRRTEVFINPGTMKEALDTVNNNNDVTIRAERYYLATWDTVLQDAILVDRAA